MDTTHQRQHPDEHVRLADKVLHVELAADFSSPVSLRTRIHFSYSRATAVFFMNGKPKKTE